MSQINIMKFSYLILLVFVLNAGCAFGNSEQTPVETDTIQPFTTSELIGKGTPTMVGKEYKKSDFKLLVVGRSVNGWDNEWKKGTSIDEYTEKVLEMGKNELHLPECFGIRW